jgi:aspartyl-tRNA(Asn)/glutamyl-tRNA(Gln) amidotransferase subunit A
VQRLKEAGAIIMGKLATHEFALGGPSFDLPWPPARNPWNPDCIPGGSSSGSGAAVSSGFVLGSAASDSGGSIRNPAAFCGLAGLKPTYGLVSRRGILPLAFSLDCPGPIAWTAEDCAILLQAMACYDPKDPTSILACIPNYQAALTPEVKGLRVGVIRHFYTRDTQANPAVCKTMDNVVKTMQELGCIVDDIELTPLFDWASCGTIIMTVEPYALHEPNLQSRFTDFGEIFRGRMVMGGLFTAADYIHAVQKRRELIEEFEQVMCDFDVLITASAPNEAPRFEACSKFSIFEKPLMTIPFNVTGSPAISVCCGYTNTGLPLGVQIAGRRFDEAKVLRLAHSYEKATSWHKYRPTLV